MISEVAIRRAISINAHPAGKRGLKRIDYPRTNSVGLIPAQTIVRHVGYVSATECIITPVIHDHANGTINCTNCL